MPLIVRDVRKSELDSVVALNNAAGTTILPFDATRVAAFFDSASYFRVIEIDGHLAGFLLALTSDAEYQSSNFLWFRERYPEFVYIDRIVVARPYRGLGLGRVFYADVVSHAEVRVPVIACEVFLEPRDDISVLFHGSFGFREVGQQVMASVNRRVSLLARDLPCYEFVKKTWIDNGGLPDVPWLADRERPVNSPERHYGS